MARLFSLPGLPPLGGMHPQVVHFPIALLFVVPLFLLAGMVIPRIRRCCLATALVLMLLGTAAAQLAVFTGEKAFAGAGIPPQALATVTLHKELAETARLVFSLLSLFFVLLQLVPLWIKRRLSPAAETVAVGAFLAFYLLALLILFNTAHNGGRLVHEFGIHGLL